MGREKTVGSSGESIMHRKVIDLNTTSNMYIVLT